MKVNVIWLSILILCYSSLNTNGEELSIECPFPEGTSVTSEERCNDFSACEWSGLSCHMSNALEATYVVSETSNLPDGSTEIFFTKPAKLKTLFGNDIPELVLKIIPHEDYHVQVKIFDPNATRYEVPIPLNLPLSPGSEPLYEVSNPNDTFNLQVRRKDTDKVILETVGPLTYEDQFIQVTFALASSYLYGLGENTHLTLRHIFQPRTTFPIWARGQGYTLEPVNLMGHHPLFMVMEDDAGHSHSVFFLNSNPMESSTFTLDDGTPALTLRAIGGIIDLHIFMGPYPEDLNKQYTKLIGFPSLPPFWYLGFQLSRYGYTDTNAVRAVVERNRAAGVPQDIQTCDIDYMYNYRIFTYGAAGWEDMPQLADELHADQLYLTLILDPPLAIDWDNYPPVERGREQDVYVNWASPFLVPSDQEPGCNDYVVGYMWPDNKTVFPDFMMQKTRDWWSSEVQILHQDISFDTLWIDMNEPINFNTDAARPNNYPPDLPDWSLKCPDNKWDSPPYPTMAARIQDNISGRLSDNTICMSSAQTDGENSYLHYDVHSLYAMQHGQATYQGLSETIPQKRPALLSRGTYSGYGKYGSHWLGDNRSSWSHMRLSIIGILEFNMFGVPMVGADICGHFDNATAELCTRWMQLGSFYSFCRNHNSKLSRDQDPASWGAEVSNISRSILLIRYTFLPYLYTLLYKANTEGASVLRPLMNVFPSDIGARDVDDQFMWGTGLMIAPVVAERAIQRNVYFPEGVWYDLLTGEETVRGSSETKLIQAPIEAIPLYIAGGNILPGQQPEIRTTLSRLNPMKLLVALDLDAYAKGELFWDDGENPNISPDTAQLASFTFQNDTLTYEVNFGSVADQNLNFNQVTIYGYLKQPFNVSLNGVQLDVSNWSYDDVMHLLFVSLNQPISENWQLTVM